MNEPRKKQKTELETHEIISFKNSKYVRRVDSLQGFVTCIINETARKNLYVVKFYKFGNSQDSISCQFVINSGLNEVLKYSIDESTRLENEIFGSNSNTASNIPY